MRASSAVQRGSRWLWPREHGAYAEVVFPLVTALGLGRVSLASLALSLAVITGFLAHEPLLVLLGARGGAALRETGTRARAQCVLLGMLGVAAAAFGLYRAEPVVTWAASALLPVLSLALVMTLAGRDKSLLGETLVALLFAFAAVPVALAAGLSAPAALRCALAWSAVFIVGTATVHALLARKKRGTLAPTYAVVGLASALSAGALMSLLSGNGSWPMAALPMSLVAVGALLLGVTPKRLRRLGWAMVLAHVGAALGLWISLRGSSLDPAPRAASGATAAGTLAPAGGLSAQP